MIFLPGIEVPSTVVRITGLLDQREMPSVNSTRDRPFSPFLKPTLFFSASINSKEHMGPFNKSLLAQSILFLVHSGRFYEEFRKV